MEHHNIVVRAWTGFLRGLTGLVCRVDDTQLPRVPREGPYIMVVNHVNIVEVPTIFTRLLDCPITPISKVENATNPLLAPFFQAFQVVYIRRGEVNQTAFRKAQEALDRGRVLVVYPEGTRSANGRLGKGRAGMTLLAMRSGAPILPLVHWGCEKTWDNIRHLRRTDFHIAVGNPFRIKPVAGALSKDLRQPLTDAVMYQMAALMPPEYRGEYSDLSQAREDLLLFDEGMPSNLTRRYEITGGKPSAAE